MPIISKLPTPRINNQLPQNRQFLTQPASYAKLGVIIVAVAILVWVNIKPAKQNTANPQSAAATQPNDSSPSDNNGQVAGATIENGQIVQRGEANPALDTGPKENLVHPVSINPSQTPKSPATVSPTIPNKPDGPTKAQIAMQAIVGDNQDLQTLLSTGKQNLDANKLDVAELAFRRATEVTPDYRDAWYLLGFACLKEFEQNPVVQLPDYAISKIDWAVIALTHAHSLDPIAQDVTDLLATAKATQEKSVAPQ